AITTLSD
ncbi:Late transcription factor VLTF-4 (1), partial [Monkeypox virus]